MNSLSHFEQTVFWARYKASTGWRYHALSLEANGDEPADACYVLQRVAFPFSRIAYLPRGPILAEYSSRSLGNFFSQLETLCKTAGISVVIIQPPQNLQNAAEHFEAFPLLPNQLFSLTSGSVVFDLSQSDEDLWKKIRPKSRQYINKGLRSGISVVEGGRDDLQEFFSLMCNSSKRQKSPPNPASAAQLEQVWDEFSRSPCKPRLFLARIGERTVSAIYALAWDETLYLWKFGWNGESSDCHPNLVLYWEIIRKARAEGFAYVDIISADPAEIREQSKHPSTPRSPTSIKLSLGGDGIIYPQSYLFAPSGPVRCLLKLATNWKLYGKASSDI